VGANASVSLRDITLQGRSGNTASLISVVSGGTLILETGAVITGNTTSGSGGGVYVATDGTFTMNDGTISGNKADGDDTISFTEGGGGVYVANGGTFTMNDGTIGGNNVAILGGGVFVADGTFMMKDGTIDGNEASSNTFGGGGVFVADGTFTMEGGIISRNKTGHGAVYLYSSSITFNKTGGIIYGTDAFPAGLANVAGTRTSTVIRELNDTRRELTAGPGKNLSYIGGNASF
jgi:nitrous oxidase accessory protein NosD